MNFTIVFISLILFLCSSVIADPIQTMARGHLKLQGSFASFDDRNIQTALDDSDLFLGQLDFRTNLEAKRDNLNAVIQLEALAFASDYDGEVTPDSGNFSSFGVVQLPSDQAKILRLTYNIDEESDIGSSFRVDRMFLEHNSKDVVLRIGRQSLSWGNGILFSALDFFNPFSPAEIDRDYKPGEDMVFSQLKFRDHDAQFLALGRRNQQDEIRTAESSFASKLHLSFLGVGTDLDLIAALHYDETYFGIGVSKTLESALVRTDLLLVDNRFLNFLINIDRSWTVFGRNLYLFGEYFHNGFGGRSGKLKSELLERLGRGEIYTIGRDYFSIGGQMELTPLMKLYSNSISNLRDFSSFFQFRIDLSLFENTSLLMGANFPFGSDNSEFGGFTIDNEDRISSIENQQSLLGSGDSYFVRFSQYF